MRSVIIRFLERQIRHFKAIVSELEELLRAVIAAPLDK